MESIDGHKSMAELKSTRRHPYVAPRIKHLSWPVATELILRHSDGVDPDLRLLISCVNEPHGEKGS
jgi:hypothetical protein